MNKSIENPLKIDRKNCWDKKAEGWSVVSRRRPPRTLQIQRTGLSRLPNGKVPLWAKVDEGARKAKGCLGVGVSSFVSLQVFCQIGCFSLNLLQENVDSNSFFEDFLLKNNTWMSPKRENKPQGEQNEVSRSETRDAKSEATGAKRSTKRSPREPKGSRGEPKGSPNGGQERPKCIPKPVFGRGREKYEKREVTAKVFESQNGAQIHQQSMPKK